MNYEDRVVAYIDILGFKDILDRTVNGKDDVPDEIDKIIKMNSVIRDAWSLDDEKKPFKAKVIKGGVESYQEFERFEDENVMGKVVTIFSDTVVVSFLASTESAVFRTITEIRWLVMNLVNRGILCRGAIARGKLIHDEKKVFGPALVSAYTMESKAALYPRVILGKEILSLAAINHALHHEPMEEVDYVIDMLGFDSDGMFYIEFIESTMYEFDNWTIEYPRYLNEIYLIISRGIDSEKPDVKIKYMWLKERYNEALLKLDIPKLVAALKKDGRDKEAEDFANVKKYDA